ncbi:feruloyl-CoA synthase [Delftia sp. PS-11]|uniref:feruloyl-CoA synthase n=1 Tax=Delftia sp. PS-11 TaxID=2767222 RepID=UPI0024543653|nr:feruloyl-CoA synthase [Delftia sp. PS-11]KAJ8742270.1 feruloyl-CoA synthase [Delftia sp. PS-11]
MPKSFMNNPANLATPHVIREELPGGGFILHCAEPLGPVARCIGQWLEQWASETPNALYLAERSPAERSPSGPWIKLTYREVRDKVGAIAQSLLDLGLQPHETVVCLSDNSIDHALLMLATMHIGRPFTTVSSAYSRLARDFTKIASIVGQLPVGAVYAADGQVYGPAIRACGLACPVILSDNVDAVPGALGFAELLGTRETPQVMQAFEAITPATHAKYLLTSGSTGKPKVVINTHRMLCANQQQMRLSWKFLDNEKPVIVSWLPWSHTFGTNHNFNMALCNGGSFYIDEGRPIPGQMEKSIRNLREVQPNLYFNVPKGFDALLPFLEGDRGFASDFFARLRCIFYAAAALPQVVWERVEDVARSVKGNDVWFASAWGATETSPVVTNVSWMLSGPGCIGLPVAGTSVKFLPNQGKLEMRVKGPQVFPGYLNDEVHSAEAFDDHGYYRIGDAGRLADEDDPGKGIVFNGRVAEDFKLTTGTWVSVGTLRLKVIDVLSPHVQDVVLTGHDQDHVGLLLFPSPSGKALAHEQWVRHVHDAMARLREITGTGSSHSPRRAMVMAEPPSLEDGEITDKGYINQRSVLARRSAQVAALHAPVPQSGVIVIG